MTLRTRITKKGPHSQAPVEMTAEGSAAAVTDWVRSYRAKGRHVTYTEGKAYKAVATKETDTHETA